MTTIDKTETIPDNCILLTPQEVAGTDLAAIGFGGSNSLLCVKRGCLSEVERLRKELYEFFESRGYVEAFLRWESWVFSAGADGDAAD